ncbi:MAG TPA: flagellar hook assembly protein FlgD [Acetobacteraceae bacterium]
MSIASVAAQQSAADAAANASQASDTALTSLSSNFGDFLGMLMTQLQNQDPTSPMDTNQFTSELVQFSSVEQQINTNASLTQLIQLTQAGEIMQSSAMVGKQVAVQSSDLTLQNGRAALSYTAPAAEPVAISITSDTGAKILDAPVTSARGTNTWTWDGTDASGNTLPDGTYKVTVTGTGTDGSSTALPFTVTGTATGVQNQNNTLTLQLGALSVPFSAVAAVGN